MRVQEVADGRAPAVLLAGRAQQWAAAMAPALEEIGWRLVLVWLQDIKAP